MTGGNTTTNRRQVWFARGLGAQEGEDVFTK